MSVFGRMESLLSDGGLNLAGDVAKNLREMLGIGKTQACDFLPPANDTIEKWSETLATDHVCFMET